MGREPVSPAGTEGLTATPCASGLDLARSAADSRTFGASTRSIEGRAAIAFLAPAIAGRAWSSSRPDALRFEEGPAGTLILLAGAPGTTLARLSLDPAAGGGEASILVSVPQFVRVRADAEFAAMLDRTLGLAGRERALIGEAKRAIDAIYERVNLRVVWSFALGEELPPQLLPGGFAAGHLIEATLHGDPNRGATPRSSLTST